MEQVPPGHGANELHTVRFLRAEGLEALVNKFGLLSSRHGAHNNLVLFKYDQARVALPHHIAGTLLNRAMCRDVVQVDSPFDAEEVQECRGLILDEAENWRPVAMPFLKFFNSGESLGANIDWSRPVRVMDKVDGSLSTLYCYKGEWEVSSSGRPDGGGVVYRTDRSDPHRKLFRDLFWQTWDSMNYTRPAAEDQHYCFMFELFSAENRIIVTPQEDLLILTGVRNMETLQEEDPTIFSERYGWRMPQTFEYTSFAEVTAAAKQLNPHFREGFVICDHQFNRVKVKSPQYVALAHLTKKDKDGLNKRRMLDIVKHNEGSEFLAYFPQWTSLFNQVKERYDELCDLAETAWAEVKDIESDRDFSLACKKHTKVADYLFMRKKGRAGSARAFYAATPEKKLEQLLPRWKSITDGKPTVTAGTPDRVILTTTSTSQEATIADREEVEGTLRVLPDEEDEEKNS